MLRRFQMVWALRRTCKVANAMVRDLVRREFEVGASLGKQRKSHRDERVPVCSELSEAHSSRPRSCKDMRRSETVGPRHSHTLQSLSQECRRAALPGLGRVLEGL